MSDKQKVKALLIKTIYGISAMEIPMVIQVSQRKALSIIQELIAEGEDIHSLSAKDCPEEMILYSIGPIDKKITKLKK